MKIIKNLMLILSAVCLFTMTGCDSSEKLSQDITEVSDIVGELADAPETPDTSEETQKAEEPATAVQPEEVPATDEETLQVMEEEPVSEEDSVQEKEIVNEEAPVAEPAYVPVSAISLSTYDVTITVSGKTMPWVTMSPADATNKKEIWVSSDTGIATVDKYGNIKGVKEGVCTVKVTSDDNKEVFATVNVTVVAPKEPENTECTYIDGILIVNKTYPLPKDYAPGWDATASDKLLEMFAAAKDEEGLNFKVLSGYRSYTDQKIIYNGYVARDGQAAADRYSARPGHSEHQSGLAFDLNKTATSFGETAEGIWLKENCHRFGFIIRYPEDKEEITGYMYEPWHVRYLGVETATAVYESGLCLEEYLGITSVYSY